MQSVWAPAPLLCPSLCPAPSLHWLHPQAGGKMAGVVAGLTCEHINVLHERRWTVSSCVCLPKSQAPPLHGLLAGPDHRHTLGQGEQLRRLINTHHGTPLELGIDWVMPGRGGRPREWTICKEVLGTEVLKR